MITLTAWLIMLFTRPDLVTVILVTCVTAVIDSFISGGSE